MLNDADGLGGDNARETVDDFSKLKKWIKTDYNSKAKSNGEEAREDFDFDASGQLNEEDSAIPT
jgi:hypothetical protein